MRALSADRASGFVLTIFAALVAWECRKLPLGGFANPGAGALPLGLAAILGALGLLVAFRGGATRLGALAWPEAPRALGILAASGFAALALETLGYRPTLFVVLVFLLGVLEKKPPLATALAALGLSAGTYWLFADLLRTPLPIGLFGV